jgi:hypothetical protein
VEAGTETAGSDFTLVIQGKEFLYYSLHILMLALFEHQMTKLETSNTFVLIVQFYWTNLHIIYAPLLLQEASFFLIAE